MAGKRAVVEMLSYGVTAGTNGPNAKPIGGCWRLAKVTLTALAVSALLVGCGGSQASQAAHYKEVNTRNATKLQQISTDQACATESNDMTECKASFQKMLGQIRTWKSELQSTRVPDCLKSSYETLRHSLDLFDEALTLILEGIPDNMNSLTLSHMQNLSQGSAKLSEAGDRMSEAMAQAENANCAA